MLMMSRVGGTIIPVTLFLSIGMQRIVAVFNRDQQHSENRSGSALVFTSDWSRFSTAAMWAQTCLVAHLYLETDSDGATT
uniref:Secreted protein n=1 Tax=Steinernema glaseri TaxID=37863 RepID=A0A1I8AD23_9BILA